MPLWLLLRVGIKKTYPPYFHHVLMLVRRHFTNTSYLQPVLIGWWLIAPAFQAVYVLGFAQPTTVVSWEIQGMHWVITAISSFFLFNALRAWSLHQIFWLFHMVFFGMVPSVHYAFHLMPWRIGDVSDSVMLLANGIVIGSLCLFAIAYALFNRRKIVAEPTRPIPSHYIVRYRKSVGWVLLICGVLLLYVDGPAGLFLRGHAEQSHERFGDTFMLVFDKVIRGTLLYMALAGIRIYSAGKLRAGALASILIIVLLLNFPLSIPRYLAATMCMALLMAGGLLQRRHSFKLLLLGLLLLVSPLISITRYSLRSPVHASLHNVADAYQISYAISDFDAYASLCRTIMYVDEMGNTGGKQLAGSVLFFVPRSVWPTKPFGSGYTVYAHQHFEFKNVACTFLAEGWINLGWMGTLAFVLIIAFITARYDSYADCRKRRRFTFLHIFYPVAIGMFLFVLRGDLMSSTAYTAGLFVMGLLWHKLLLYRKNG